MWQTAPHYTDAAVASLKSHTFILLSWKLEWKGIVHENLHSSENVWRSVIRKHLNKPKTQEQTINTTARSKARQKINTQQQINNTTAMANRKADSHLRSEDCKESQAHAVNPTRENWGSRAGLKRLAPFEKLLAEVTVQMIRRNGRDIYFRRGSRPACFQKMVHETGMSAPWRENIPDMSMQLSRWRQYEQQQVRIQLEGWTQKPNPELQTGWTWIPGTLPSIWDNRSFRNGSCHGLPTDSIRSMGNQSLAGHRGATRSTLQLHWEILCKTPIRSLLLIGYSVCQSVENRELEGVYSKRKYVKA